jgi:nucleotide-binding universal stress UspA family protein
MARVLIATDGSDFSIQAAQRALPLLREDPQITVLAVAPRPLGGNLMAGPEGAGFAPAPQTTAEIEQMMGEEAQGHVDRMAEALGVPVAARVERGDARLVICQVAEEGFDLIVIGSHGSGLIKRVLLGSVSHHVLHHAPCPVLVVRSGD